MLILGQYNRLTVLDDTSHGFYLGYRDESTDRTEKNVDNRDRRVEKIFLPRAEVNEATHVGDKIDVFLYVDSEDRVAATTKTPLVRVGEFAWLKIVDVSSVGAFLDWGLPKDLFLPYAEQKFTPEVGRRVLVRVYLDNSNRLAASTRIDTFLEEDGSQFTVGQEVQLLIADSTELGYKAIVNNSHWGVLYNSELFQSIRKGQKITGYIRKVRDDKKLDLSLSRIGFGQVEELTEKIVATLKQNDGFIMITDKSPPEAIYALFKVSKKVYKKAIGVLYRQQKIDIEKTGIRWLDKD
ncbi:MAG: S1-like domain-containing RNA-binding protein [Oceanicoccus sp.]